MKASTEILRHHHLRATPIRIKILEIFSEADSALSNEDIESHFKNLDRITLYRTLKSFEEKGIIHKILNSGPTPLYAMCAEECNVHHHKDDHGHFHCMDCGKTYCLDDVLVPDLKLPRGFKIEQNHLVMEGTCPGCND